MELSIDEWKKMFDANLFSLVSPCQLLFPYMKGNKASHILNIGSMGGVPGTSKFAGLSAYSASKAAVTNLTECLAEELKVFNVYVNRIASGAVNTEMLQAVFPNYKAPINRSTAMK